MRNLKRTLSLALTAIMLLGMMIINVSAADSVYDSFTDIDEIVNKDAVNLLVTLGIVNGKEDGSYFDPTGDVTRAEMAKMIAVALNKGVDDTELYIGMNTGLTDVKGHWAEGSINFCVNRGIIAGRGDGTFDPAANVTAAEAAKMLLVAVGYDPTIEGFVGNNWAGNVTAKASSLSMFDGYNGSMLAELNRDDAALLIYNTLDIAMVQSYINGYAITTGIGTNSNPQTILSSVYGVLKIKGVVTANKWASLEDRTNNNSGTVTGSVQDRVDNHLIDNRTKLSNIQVYTSNTVATNTSSSLLEGLSKTELTDGTVTYYRTFNVDTPVEYLGQTVTMYIRKTTVLTDYEVLGVYLREIDNDVVTKDVAATATTGNDSVLKNTGLIADNNTRFFVNYGEFATTGDVATELACTKDGRGIDVTIIDNNKDGVADYILYLRRDLNVVSMSKNNVVLRNYNSNNSISADSIVTNLSLATDDVVLVVNYGERYYIEEPDVITGVMTAYNNNNTTTQTIDVDGTTYYQSAIGLLEKKYSSAHGQNDILDLDVTLCETDAGVQFKNTYEFFLDTHGNIRAFRPTEESLPNYALILNSGYNPGVYSSDASGKVTALLADGTEDTFTLNFTASANNVGAQLSKSGNKTVSSTGGDSATFSKSEQGIIELKAFLGTDYTDNSTTRPWRFTMDNTNTPSNYTTDTSFIFAYRGVNGTVSEQPKEDYRAGNAAGYLVSYTLNNDGVMTIKNIIGGVTDKAASVIDNPASWNNFRYSTDAVLKGAGAKTLSTDGYELAQDYKSGTGNVWFKTQAGTASRDVAIDRNTVAFYYDVASNGDKYGVRVGYDDMDGVSISGGAVRAISSNKVTVDYDTTVTPAKVTYKDSRLAEAILFGQCTEADARDYAYVLGRNSVYSDYALLNVIFEDGTAGTLKLKSNDYETYFENDRTAYSRLWAYSIGADGFATVKNDPGVFGDGYALKDGTIELLCGNYATTGNFSRFRAVSSTLKTWDIDSMSAGKDAEPYGAITTVSSRYVMLHMVPGTNGAIRTIFVSEKNLEHAYSVGHGGGGGGNHQTHVSDHDWDFYQASYLGADYKFANNYADVVAALASGVDVRVAGDLNLSGSLTIPAGRTVRIQGDLDARNYDISGDGNLVVIGDLDNTRGTLGVANVIVTGDWTLSTNTTVSSDLMYVGNIKTTGFDLQVASGSDVHVGYDVDGDGTDDLTGGSTSGIGDVTGAGTDITVNGHLEGIGNIAVNTGTVTVNSNETLVVGGTLTAGTLRAAKAANDSGDPVVTVAGKTEVKNLTGVTGAVWALEEVAITTGGTVNLAGQTVVVGGDFDASAADSVSYTNTDLVVAPTSENVEGGVSIKLNTTAANAPAITISNENLDAEDKADGVTSVSIVVVNANGDEKTIEVSDAVAGTDSDLSGITIKLTEDESGEVTPDLGGDIVQTTLSITLTTGNGDYVSGTDTNAVVVDFTDAAEGTSVVLGLTSSANAKITVTVGDATTGTESTGTGSVSLVAGAAETTTTITVTAEKDGEAITTKTITVKGGTVANASAPGADEGENA